MSSGRTAPDQDAQAVRVSIVIPARDEERTLPLALQSVAEAVNAVGGSVEVIVVNDGLTDRTAAITREAGAGVIDVQLHNIGAVRNAGAKAATGDVLVFLDADTQLPAETLPANRASRNRVPPVRTLRHRRDDANAGGRGTCMVSTDFDGLLRFVPL